MQYDLQPNNKDHFEEDGISLHEALFLLKKYYKQILVFVISFFFFAVFKSILEKPIYESSGMILIEDPSSTIDIFEMGMGSPRNFLENETEIIQSRSTAEKTVFYLLNSKHKNNLHIFNTKQYFHPFGSFLPFLNDSSDDIEYIETIESIPESVIASYIARFQGVITVTNQRNTDVLKINVESVDPIEASLLVNSLIDVYKNIDIEWETGEMSHLKQFLVQQISYKEIELQKSEDMLESFQKKDKVFGVDGSAQLILNNLMDAEAKLHEVSAEKNINDERQKYIQNQLTIEEKKLTQRVSNSINEKLYALKHEIAIKESELVSAISQQGAQHSIVVSIQEKLSGLKVNLEKETRNLIAQGIAVANPIEYRQSLVDSVISLMAYSAMLETKEIEFSKLVTNYETQLTSLPQKVLEFSRLSRNVRIQSDTYKLMRQKLEEAKINEASQIGKVRIVDLATPMFGPVKPNRKLNLIIGMMLGLLAGIGYAYLREYFDNTVKSLQDIEKYNIPLLALIPLIGEKYSKKQKTKKYQKQLTNPDKIQRRLITHEDPKSPVSESYRSLRTSLMYSHNIDKTKRGNVVMVSSPGPSEGKTTTVANLAITYANLGLKTILVDADLRKPVLHSVFSISKEPGLTKVLSGLEQEYKKIIVQSDIENLDIITSGIIPPNPSELLASQPMRNLIESLKEEYDVVLMDAPPLLAVTDAFVSLSFVDQFVMVIRSGISEKSGLLRAINQFKQSNLAITGIVLNALDESASYGSGYYTNYYQYYYSSDDEK